MDPIVELAIRVSFFAVVFAAMALWEVGAPRRALVAGRNLRWPNNLGILLIGVICVRVLIPTAAVGAALFAAGRGWGLFHVAGLRLSVAALLGFLVLDLVIYAQHVVFHKVPLLWRLHRMHHADLDIDVTTGGRFHPFEILISMLIKIATVIAFGIPVVAVVLFELVLNAANVNLVAFNRFMHVGNPMSNAQERCRVRRRIDESWRLNIFNRWQLSVKTLPCAKAETIKYLARCCFAKQPIRTFV